MSTLPPANTAFAPLSVAEVLGPEGLAHARRVGAPRAVPPDQVAVIDPLAEPPDPRLVDRLGAAVCLRHGILPWRMIGGETVVLAARPGDFGTVRDMLIRLGHSVIEAGSVDEAMALTADLPEIALILSDINLQGGATGLDLLDRLRGSGLPCILMTSLPPEDPLHAAGLQRTTVLRKPFSDDQLAALIRPKAAE